MIKYIVMIILLFSVVGWDYKYSKNKHEERIVEDNAKFEQVLNASGYKPEYKEWLFINEKRWLESGGVGSGMLHSGYFEFYGGYHLSDKLNPELYKERFKEYYETQYKTIENMGKRWKGKKEPKGMRKWMDTMGSCLDYTIECK